MNFIRFLRNSYKKIDNKTIYKLYHIVANYNRATYIHFLEIYFGILVYIHMMDILSYCNTAVNKLKSYIFYSKLSNSL